MATGQEIGGAIESKVEVDEDPPPLRGSRGPPIEPRRKGVPHEHDPADPQGTPPPEGPSATCPLGSPSDPPAPLRAGTTC